jgi:hypothetical protein
MKVLERALDVTKRALSDAYIVRILESISLRLFEDRPEGNSSAGAQPFWLDRTAYNRYQAVSQLVVDHCKVAR